MTTSDLTDLFGYNYWANAKLLAVVSSLSNIEFCQEVAGSYGSVRNTLVHVLSTEWGWLSRCGGLDRGARLEADDFPDATSLIEQWREVETHMMAFIRGLSDEDLARDVEYPGAGGAARVMRIGELLHHAAIHAVHHRAQVALMLRELGHAPGNMDLLFYYAEQRGVRAW